MSKRAVSVVLAAVLCVPACAEGGAPEPAATVSTVSVAVPDDAGAAGVEPAGNAAAAPSGPVDAPLAPTSSTAVASSDRTFGALPPGESRTAAGGTQDGGEEASDGAGRLVGDETTTTVHVWPEYPRFASGPAPVWPFHGLVQLWPVVGYVQREGQWEARADWTLRYWGWDAGAQSYAQVALPGLRIDCIGQVALVHDERGVVVGGPPGAANATFMVPWGGLAEEATTPSATLSQAGRAGASNVAVVSEGDWVRLGSGREQRSYAMRDPARTSGSRWDVRARHDGELFLLTVHPAHLPCYSGVTWLSLAATGEPVACGANSAATAFVSPPGSSPGGLVLPEPEQMDSYLSCGPQLDLTHLPFTQQRELIKR